MSAKSIRDAIVRFDCETGQWGLFIAGQLTIVAEGGTDSFTQMMVHLYAAAQAERAEYKKQNEQAEQLKN